MKKSLANTLVKNVIWPALERSRKAEDIIFIAEDCGFDLDSPDSAVTYIAERNQLATTYRGKIEYFHLEPQEVEAEEVEVAEETEAQEGQQVAEESQTASGCGCSEKPLEGTKEALLEGIREALLEEGIREALTDCEEIKEPTPFCQGLDFTHYEEGGKLKLDVKIKVLRLGSWLKSSSYIFGATFQADSKAELTEDFNELIAVFQAVCYCVWKDCNFQILNFEAVEKNFELLSKDILLNFCIKIAYRVRDFDGYKLWDYSEEKVVGNLKGLYFELSDGQKIGVLPKGVFSPEGVRKDELFFWCNLSKYIKDSL